MKMIQAVTTESHRVFFLKESHRVLKDKVKRYRGLRPNPRVIKGQGAKHHGLPKNKQR